MKKLAFVFLISLTLIGCDEGESYKQDPRVGKWSLQTNDGALKFSFEVQKAGLSVIDHRVQWTTIPVDQEYENNVIFYDRFANGGGYGRVEILSRGDVHYSIILIYNRFDEDGNMLVYDMICNMPGFNEFVIHDAVVMKQ